MSTCLHTARVFNDEAILHSRDHEGTREHALTPDGDAARVSGIKFLNKQRAVLDRAHQDVRGVKRGLQRQARRNNERRLTGNCAGGLIAMK